MTVELGIHTVFRQDGGALLHGVCHEGPIALGTRFRSAFPSSNWTKDQKPIPVNLLVERLVAYERELKTINRGLSVAITVSGDLPRELSSGWMLTSP